MWQKGKRTQSLDYIEVTTRVKIRCLLNQFIFHHRPSLAKLCENTEKYYTCSLSLDHTICTNQNSQKQENI